jgi:hypothetical protein
MLRILAASAVATFGCVAVLLPALAQQCQGGHSTAYYYRQCIMDKKDKCVDACETRYHHTHSECYAILCQDDGLNHTTWAPECQNEAEDKCNGD